MVSLLFSFAACATPHMRISERFRAGQVRTYRLTATAETTTLLGARKTVDRTTLVATSRETVLDARPGATTVRLALVPERFSENGRSAEPPTDQEADVVIGADGAVKAVSR